MSPTPNITHTSAIDLPILDILEGAGVCFSIKGSDLNFLYHSSSFNRLLGITKKFSNDFELFLPEIAFEIAQEDGIILTSGIADDVDRVLITKEGKELVVRLTRSIVNHQNTVLLVTTYSDITKLSQNRQFEAYKKVLTDGEVFEKMLNRFSQLIFSSHSRKDVLEGVGTLCLDLLDLEDLSIFLVHKEKQVLQQTLIVRRNKAINYDQSGTKYNNIPISEGITGKCVRTMTTILLDDVSLDQDYIKDTAECKSEIAVPIIYKNEVLGVIDSESTQLSKYTDKTKRTIEGIASLLAIKLNEIESLEELETKNRQLLSLVKHNPVALAMLDLEGNYLQVSNDWMHQFVPSKYNSIIGLNHFELNPNIPIRWKKIMDKAYEGQHQILNKEGYERRNGNVEFFTGKVNPWYISEGKVGGIIIQADNVTKSVNDETKLLESHNELAEAKFIGQLFSWEINMENGTMHVDTGKKVIPGIENGKQYDLDIFFKFIDSDYHSDINQAIEYALKSKGTFSLTHPFKVGRHEFWMQNRGKVITKNGVITHVKGTAQNITDQIEAQNAYKQKNTELKQINRELDQFVYKTAHDLRAPLANITGLISLMRMEDNPKILATYFDLQEKSVTKLDTFIQKITNYTKNTRLPVAQEEIKFNTIVDNVLKDHMFIAGSDKVQKKLIVDKSQLYYSDSERITIILNNLIANAIQFKDDKKEASLLEINIKPEGQFVHLIVRDNGLGIADEFKGKVFDMFYRAHKSADGSGIGLYIVRETVRKLGGSILLNTEEGEFTEFNILLPNVKL